MPKFFFHVEDGFVSLDETGSELADFKAAQAEALLTCGEILREMGRQFWSETKWRMWVTDEAGTTLFTLHFTAEPGTAAPMVHDLLMPTKVNARGVEPAIA